MRKINSKDIAEVTWSSPKGKFVGAGKEVSEALGRKPQSTDLNERHPFDVEISRIPPGKRPYPYHSHSAQWEFYHVISGQGIVRHQDGTTPIEIGDAFIFKPGEPHQLINNGAQDLVLYVVADNPVGESCHYPDSGKWAVDSPKPRVPTRWTITMVKNRRAHFRPQRTGKGSPSSILCHFPPHLPVTSRPFGPPRIRRAEPVTNASTSCAVEW